MYFDIKLELNSNTSFIYDQTFSNLSEFYLYLSPKPKLHLK